MRWLWILGALIILLAIAFIISVAIRSRQLRDADAAAARQGATEPETSAEPIAPVHVSADDSAPLGLPVSRERRLQVLEKPHFTVGYDNARREPAWVAYHLAGPIRHHGKEHRPEKFAPDSEAEMPARHEDYTRSGFDRGHMCPAYAMFSRFGLDAMAETFVTSNIIPQRHSLNAGMWEEVEQMIAGRDGDSGGWAERFQDVWITDGPVITPDDEALPAGEAVPSACFMIVLRRDGGHWSSLAFEMPNAELKGSPAGYLVSIRQIETETKLDFDSALPFEQQEAIEAKPAGALW